MRQRNVFLAGVAVVAVAALVLAGGVVASNMGFKLNLTLLGSGDVASNSGRNFVGLPYNQQVGLNAAKDLYFDIGGTIQSISQHRKSDDQFEFYSASVNTVPPDGFPLAAGECYIVITSATQQYVIVGSHDPGLAISLLGSADAGSESGRNFYTHPYHSTASNAKELYFEIGGSIQSVSQHRKSDDQFEFYSASVNTVPPDGFPLNPGECYIVITSSNESITPAHY